MVWLSAALLLCSYKESCFHFVNGGGMKQLSDIFCTKVHSSAATLILLGVIKQATRFSIGCEGFLNWWPREDDKIPTGTSDGYNQLIKLLMQKPRHDVASLATYILHRVRFYEVASRYEVVSLFICFFNTLFGLLFYLSIRFYSLLCYMRWEVYLLLVKLCLSL